MRRREALSTGCCLLAAYSAGCLETLRREDAWRELVVDPPDGVYVPPKVDGMVRYGSTTADGRAISVTATRPHSFWTVTDAERSRADLRSRHALHLMVHVRDAETGIFIPTSVTTTIRSQTAATTTSNPVDQRSLWPMLSQRMGAHYGDNVSLEGDGAYTVTIQIGPPTAVTTGGLDDRLETPTTVDLDFEYDAAEIEGLERRLIDADERRGESGALEPMAAHANGGDEADVNDEGSGHESDADRDVPALDGAIDSGTATRVGVGESSDIVFPTVFLDGDGQNGLEAPTLAVAPRTRYNRFPLAFASLSVTVVRNGERIASESLRETIDPRLGHHYSTALDPGYLERGDELSIRLETPPQVARHEGYETAFLEQRSATIALEKN